MKTNKLLIIAVCLSMLVFSFVSPQIASAEMTYWAMYDFPLDSASVQAGISKVVGERDFIPVGIESVQDKMSVLFVSNASVGALSWKITSYASSELFTDGLDAHLAQGYTPIDVSHDGKFLSVLYLKLKVRAEDWRWNVTQNETATVSQEIERLVPQGFIPIGVTMIDGKFAVLLIKSAAFPVTHWAISVISMKNDQLIAGINNKIREGYLPWGFLAGVERANIVFLRGSLN